MIPMYKTAVIGDMESVYGFSSLGVDTYFTKDIKSARSAIKAFSKEDYAVIFITEDIASQIYDDLEALNLKTLPAIVPIPGTFKNTGIGSMTIRRAIIKAVGSEI